MHTYHIKIKGLVQGIGFRPFIYRTAIDMGLEGNVYNNNEGVEINVTTGSATLNRFIERILREKPELCFIEDMNYSFTSTPVMYDGFSIIPSSNISEKITAISPDLGMCDECISDMRSDKRRLSYPFINCTNCGPRFSIIREIPYDRSNTSMSCFKMCGNCKKDYTDMANRRFHAQPIACNFCGPTLNSEKSSNQKAIIKRCAMLIDNDEIVAIKGIGGFNLLCNANSDTAISRLREIKQRNSKPFAIMARDIETAHKIAHISAREERLLQSQRKPIVILDSKNHIFPGSLCGGMSTIGIILPYAPVHHLLFENLSSDFVVFTSANIGSEPIICNDQEMRSRFGTRVAMIASHNRDIENRVDDSVARIVGNEISVMRRSRGFTPASLITDNLTDGILALGAEMNSTFSIGKDKEIICSQYIGNTANPETRLFFEQSLNNLTRMFHHKMSHICCDMHPDYYTTRFAESLSASLNIPIIKIQHHHAHAAACMAEHKLSAPTLSLIFDGTGYHPDGNIHGSEVMICTHESYQTINHFDFIPLPGGDKCSAEPWRSALSYLDHHSVELPEAFIESIGEGKIDMVRRAIDRRVNSPLSCGAGRLFDAVASICLNLHLVNNEAQAPMLLESIADPQSQLRYNIDEHNPMNIRYILKEICIDIKKGKDAGEVSTKFHNTLATTLYMECIRQLKEHDLQRNVILSGGCFQNKFLVEKLSWMLEKDGIRVFSPHLFPSNDSAISVGQCAIASRLRI